MQKAVSLSTSITLYKGGLGHAHARAGNSAEARKLLSELNRLSQTRYVSGCDVAAIYAGLGEKDQAFASLERAYEQHDPRLFLWVNRHPLFDPLRSDPRLHDLLRRVGLPP
jgi:tetratricopeptide (TPR) repeat protein